MNVGMALGTRLKDGTCRVYGSDLRVQIHRRTLYTYPDATVVCGEIKAESHHKAGATVTNPRVIVEVLSPSTELYDRGEKFALYREIPSLAEYVLISQSHSRIETYFRHDDGGWSFGPYSGLESSAKLLSLKIELPLAEVYAGITFPAA
jgi:Uma2 family endonuclease